MVYLSRRRRRRVRFWAFVLLLVWVLGIAAMSEVTMLAAHALIVTAAVAVDLIVGRRRRPPRRRRSAGTARRPGTAT